MRLGLVSVILSAVWLWQTAGVGYAWTENAEAGMETQKLQSILESDVFSENFDFTEIQDYLDALKGGGSSISFREVVSMLLKGEWKEVGEQMVQSVKDSLFSEISSGRRIFIQILVIGIAGAVFTNFASVFDKSQISDAGFYVTYLLLFSLLAAGFMNALEIASEVMDKVIGFMRVLMPAYFMAVAFTGNTGSAVVMYETMLFFMYGMEQMIRILLLPLLKTYIFLVLAGHLSREDLLSKMTSLVGKSVSWGLKTMVGVVFGVQMLQGLVLPYVDAVKNGTLQKLLQIIPGVGQAAESAMQMVLGAGVLIKNTIGVAAVFILGAICALPVLKLLLLLVFYHLATAVLQPICDKRMVSCISEVANGHQLLVNMVLAVCVLFFISIAVICASSNVVCFAG